VTARGVESVLALGRAHQQRERGAEYDQSGEQECAAQR
jgi:hypothetical protein